MYSSLFTAGLQRAERKQEEKTLFPVTSNQGRCRHANRAPVPAQHQRLQVPSNPALTFSPSRRGRFAQLSPRRKIRSSFTSSAASPLAGIKTPVKAAEVAARMQNMLLSPSRPQNRPILSTGELPDMSGAPAKPKASSRLRRGLPAKKPPPTLPLPSIPLGASGSFSIPPGNSRLPPLPTIPPMQPVFSPGLLPTFTITAATPTSTPQNNRVTMMVDDVFGPPRLHPATPHSGDTCFRLPSRNLPPAYPESPTHPGSGWR